MMICARDCAIEALSGPIKNHDTATLFDWLIEIFSLQGISDAVAFDYIAEHGNVRWSDVAERPLASAIMSQARRLLAFP